MRALVFLKNQIPNSLAELRSAVIGTFYFANFCPNKCGALYFNTAYGLLSIPVDNITGFKIAENPTDTFSVDYPDAWTVN